MVGRPVAERVVACVGALLVGTSALAALAAAARAANTPDEFAVVAVDARTSPAFSLDVHVPQRERLNTYSTSQFTLSGGTDLSISRVTPDALDVVLVIDDRATTSATALALLKSAAVELVRDLDDGTRLDVETIASTPTSVSSSSSTSVSSSSRTSFSFSTDKRQITDAIAAAGAGPPASSGTLGGASVGLRLAGIASRAVASPERRTRLVAFVQPDAAFTAVDRSVLEQVSSRTRTTLSALVIGAPAGTSIDAGGSTAVTIVDDGPNNLVASVDRLARTLTSLYQVSFRASSPSVVLTLQAVAETYRTTIDVGLPESAALPSTGAPPVPPAAGSLPDTDVGSGSSTPATTTGGAPAAAAVSRRGEEAPVKTLALVALVGSLLGAAGALVVFGLHRRRRAARPRAPETLRFGRLVLDEGNGEARAGQCAVELDEREAAALGALMRRPGRILWVDADGAFGGAGPRLDVGVAGHHLGTRTLTALGQKLDGLGEGDLLHLVPGGGYLADDDLDDRFDPLDDGDDLDADPRGGWGARDRHDRLEPGSRTGGSGRRAAS